jgi:hypothetical protein
MVASSSRSETPTSLEASAGSDKFHWLSANPGKRRTEIIYVIWFLVSVPIQGLVTSKLSYTHHNDLPLVGQSVFMALGTLIWPLVFRVADDKGRPLRDLYGFRMGIFLIIWAVLGGFIGTDPWYEVLHGHFAFNTALNPNGVPLFMLPMTISVFSFYSVILGTLYRVLTQLLDRTHSLLAADTTLRHVVLCALLAGIMPLGETFAYTGSNYCFDNGVGMWGLNVLIYGSWHFAALLFYTRWDTQPGQRAALDTTILSGFATLGILMVLTATTSNFIAPQFVNVEHGLRQINDWSPHNCLGPKPK